MNHNQKAVKLVESFINANYEEGSKALDQLMVFYLIRENFSTQMQSDWNLDSYVENVMGSVQGYILDKFIKQVFHESIAALSSPINSISQQSAK